MGRLEGARGRWAGKAGGSKPLPIGRCTLKRHGKDHEHERQTAGREGRAVSGRPLYVVGKDLGI